MGRIDRRAHLRGVGGGQREQGLEPVLVHQRLARALPRHPAAVDQLPAFDRLREGAPVHQRGSSWSCAGVVTTKNTRLSSPVLVKLWRTPGGTYT